MDQCLAEYLNRLSPSGNPDAVEMPDDTGTPALPFRQQLSAIGLPSRLTIFVSAHLGEAGILIASWIALGAGALNGRLDSGWLVAWALCLATTIPLRIAARSLEGTIGIGFGGLLKQRVFAGATAMDPDEVHRKGTVPLFSEVLESEVMEREGSSGAAETLMACLELLPVPVVLVWGAAPGPEVAVFLFWVILSAGLAMHNARLRFEWTRSRLHVTHSIVEKMTAHRTRLVQEPASKWHAQEDAELAEYGMASEKFDRSVATLRALLPRGYALAALAALSPSFLSGKASVAAEAVAFGTILFAASAFERLAFGLQGLMAAQMAWRRVRPVFEAGAKTEVEGVVRNDSAIGNAMAGITIQVKDVVFVPPARREAVLKSCSLKLESGDQMLLESRSGSGKSTFASLIGGFRRPTSGVILAGGLDYQTLGARGWRRRIVMAPQYHENHILSAPLGFNLLLSHPLPHDDKAMEEARAICEELGLGPLLDRMPGGLDQMVGETGWRLSHGEMSRVFIARALLQGAECVILDELFAALDPENLRQCMTCVQRRAKTLMVIAHP